MKKLQLKDTKKVLGRGNDKNKAEIEINYEKYNKNVGN